ncbi:monofunctional biosynthetic peptidoglycan transglycosylase [Phaeovulum sp.]|uniref:monofunctional biosynthetic peptidoglycan transglycosylase n=1 Tax=Phaeovulum sp. TaxID=2934796 RepID=UPI003561DE25
MAKKKSAPPEPPEPPRRGLLARALRWVWYWFWRGAVLATGLMLTSIAIYAFVNPPITMTILGEWWRLGQTHRKWVPIEDINPVMARSVVAAEDANFCLHWGFDVPAIRAAIAEGGTRGGSTISQQVTKNVFLWQGRSWPRKAFEAAITPMVELVWTKRRVLEVYLNVAEFDTGVFGVHAAAEGYFNTTPDKLTARQAALLAAVLPDPKRRDAANPSAFVSRRAEAIADGAETIKADGRTACWE